MIKNRVQAYILLVLLMEFLQVPWELGLLIFTLNVMYKSVDMTQNVFDTSLHKYKPVSVIVKTFKGPSSLDD